MSKSGCPKQLTLEVPYPENREVFQMSNISAAVLNWFLCMLYKMNAENRLFPSFFFFFFVWVSVYLNTAINLHLLSCLSSAL